MADDTDKPESKQTDTDLVEVIRAYVRESRDHYSQGSPITEGGWRAEAEMCYAYVAGDQWSETDVAVLKEQLRPVITYNRVGPVIDSVSGWEVSNRQDVRYIPRNEGDASVNELYTQTAEWVRDECDAEDEESDAFVDVLICGIGCTETRTEYQDDPDGKIISGERVDPLEMCPDPRARKKNLSDATRLARIRDISRADFEARWPDKVEIIDGSDETGTEDDEITQHVNDPRETYNRTSIDKPSRKGMYRVIEYQWCESQPVTRALINGQLQEVPARVAKALKERRPDIKVIKQAKRVYMRAFMCNGQIVDRDTSPCPFSFTYKFITGKRDRNNNTWYGLVRAMIGPQQWANKFFSTTLHHMNTAGKGIIANPSAFKNVREVEERWSSADSVIWTKAGVNPAEAAMPKPFAPLPPGLSDLMTFTLQSFREVTGVNMELMGLVNRDQPGVLEYQRKQAGLTILASIFDNLRRYRKEQGRVLLYFIMNYLPEGTLVRINAGSGLEKFIPFMRQPETMKFDVIVDTSPTSPNQKESTWAVLQPMLATVAKMMPPQVWPIILEASPLPESFTQKINGVLKQMAQQPPAPDPAMVKAQADIQAKQAMLQMDAQSKAQDAQLKQQQMETDLAMQWRQHQQEMQIMQEKAGLEAQTQREKAQLDAELKMAMAAQDAQIKQQYANDESRATGASVAVNLDANEQMKGIAEHFKAIGDSQSKSQEVLVKTLADLSKAMTAKKRVKTPRGVYETETVN